MNGLDTLLLLIATTIWLVVLVFGWLLHRADQRIQHMGDELQQPFSQD